MRNALRNVEQTPEHVALAYDAWGRVGDDGKVPSDQRKDWLSALARTPISPDYASSFKRWEQSFSSTSDRLATLTLESRLLIGHGNGSAVDVGLTVHHTWGVPIIPGSALKGLVAHYVDATFGPSDPNKKPWEQQGDERTRAQYQGVTWNGNRIERGPGAIYRTLFGSPDALDDDLMREHELEAGAATGLVTFHDALYVPESFTDRRPFAADVLTVHQKRYYDSLGNSAPNDFDSPNPVAFLTVRPECKFLLALSGPEERLTELAGQLLTDALRTWGVGGKTSAGYGIGTVDQWKKPAPRLSRSEQITADLEKHGKDALSGDIEKWLRGEAVVGPMREVLSAAPEATTEENLMVVQLLATKLKLQEAWANRLKNKKADEQKKARARALIETWDKLFLGRASR